MKDQHMLHHEEWKNQALPKINNQPPTDFHHIMHGRLERELKSRERKIREENLIMLGKFYKILNRQGQKSAQPYVTSLNTITRRKEQERITSYNMKFSQTLQEVKPTYGRNHWQQHIQKIKKLRKQHQSAHFMPQAPRYPGQPFYQIRQRVGVSEQAQHQSVGNLSRRSKGTTIRGIQPRAGQPISEEMEGTSSRRGNQTLPLSGDDQTIDASGIQSEAEGEDKKELENEEMINYQSAGEGLEAFPPKKKRQVKKKKAKLSMGLQMLEPADYKIRNPIIRQMTNELQHLRVKKRTSKKPSSASFSYEPRVLK